MNPYGHGLERNDANYTPLTPVSFLAKAAYVYSQRVAVIHGDVRRTWDETYRRSRQLASPSHCLVHLPWSLSCCRSSDCTARLRTP